MTLRERRIGLVTVLDLSGPITGRGAAEQVDAALRHHLIAGSRMLVANLDEVPAIDLDGLNALVEGYRAVRHAGGVLTLAGVTKRLHDLVILTRLLTVFDTYDTVDEALNDLAGVSSNQPAMSPFAAADEGFLRRA